MATRKSASQLFQLVILLSLLVWQCVKLEKQETVSLAEAYGIEPTGVQWPFVVAATIFLMEFLLCFLLLLLLRLMLYFKDPGSGEVLFLSRLREVAEMLAFISFFSGVYYIFQVCRKHDHESPMGSGSLFRDTREVREGRHMLLWTLLAPQQWVMHARLYTKASWQEAGNLMISTAFTMVFGLCASQVDMTRTDAWIPPHWQVRFYYLTGCSCLLTTYVRAHRFPIEPAIAKTGRFYLNVKYVIWSCYPMIFALRSFGFISPWQEEVLCFTALDLIAKSLSLIASSTGPLFTLFVSTWGHWHVSGGLHDIRVTVSDPNWSVQSVQMDQSTGVEQITGLSSGSDFLREAVPHPEDRRRLLQISKQVDRQLSFMAQKTMIKVDLADGARVSADCYVSRSLWGSRQLALTLTAFSAYAGDSFNMKDDVEDDAWSLDSLRTHGSDEESQSQQTASTRRQPTESAIQGSGLTAAKVSLHQYMNQVASRRPMR